MALPTSGPMSLEMIRAEFGGGYPVRLSDYYRGGGLVPNNPANAGVPASGAISLSHFYGASDYLPVSATVSQTGGSVFIPEPAPPSTVVGCNLIAHPSGGNGSYTYEWRDTPGGAVISTGSSLYVSGEVMKNSSLSLTRYLRVSDGVSFVDLTPQASLTYTSNV